MIVALRVLVLALLWFSVNQWRRPPTKRVLVEGGRAAVPALTGGSAAPETVAPVAQPA